MDKLRRGEIRMNQKQHDALETIIAEVKKEIAKNYEQGYQDGLKKGEDIEQLNASETKKKVAKQNYELGYTIGLDDAWTCARMLVDISTYMDGAIMLEKRFGKASLMHIFENYSADKAIKKLQGYEEELFLSTKAPTDIPKVGDEIEKEDGQIGVIVDVNDITEKANILWASGNITHALGFKRFKLTGRNFKEVVALLDKMAIGEAEE